MGGIGFKTTIELYLSAGTIFMALNKLRCFLRTSKCGVSYLIYIILLNKEYRRDLTSIEVCMSRSSLLVMVKIVLSALVKSNLFNGVQIEVLNPASNVFIKSGGSSWSEKFRMEHFTSGRAFPWSFVPCSDHFLTWFPEFLWCSKGRSKAASLRSCVIFVFFSALNWDFSMTLSIKLMCPPCVQKSILFR